MSRLWKAYLDRLYRLARSWGRADSAPFRPRLELLEPRAAPSGLAMVEAFVSPASAEPAVFRVSESLATERARPTPALACRSFDDRLFGDESAERVRDGNDLEVLFAVPMRFDANDLAGSDLYTGKDDVSSLFARNDGAACDVVFIGANW